MKAGDNCVVTGAGMIGIFVIKLLKIAGAGMIIAIDNDPDKLSGAKQCGADETLDPSQGNPGEKIKVLTNSRGADISFEAVGKNETVNTAIDSNQKGRNGGSDWQYFKNHRVAASEGCYRGIENTGKLCHKG